MSKKTAIRLVSLILMLIGFQAGSAWAQSILIFSTSHSNTGPSEVKKAVGAMKLIISSFSPIQEIRINDEVRQTQSATTVQFEIPYQLQEGENSYNIKVITEEAEQQKAFILNYVKPEYGDRPDKGPFRLITAAGLIYTDNTTAVKEDKTAGSKLFLTVIPQYRITMDLETDLLVRGIVMREKFSDSDLETLETVFTQVDAKYMKQAAFGDWQLVAGLNDIGGQTSGLTAENKVETNLFLGGSVKLDALDEKRVSLGGKLTLKNAEDASSEDYDRDGSLLNLNAKWKRTFDNIAATFKGDYDFYDAKGLYEDYSALGVGAEGKIPMDKLLTLNGGLDMTLTAYNKIDPRKGDKEASTLITLSVGGTYKLPDFFGITLIGDLTVKQQSSNITTKEYAENRVSVSAVYIY